VLVCSLDRLKGDLRVRMLGLVRVQSLRKAKISLADLLSWRAHRKAEAAPRAGRRVAQHLPDQVLDARVVEARLWRPGGWLPFRRVGSSGVRRGSVRRLLTGTRLTEEALLLDCRLALPLLRLLAQCLPFCRQLRLLKRLCLNTVLRPMDLLAPYRHAVNS
jgi:hypothetical protein